MSCRCKEDTVLYMGYLATLPGRLTVRRFCTGEVRLSLTSGCSRQVNDRLVLDKVLCDERRRVDISERLCSVVSGLEWGSRAGVAIVVAIFNCSEKFAGRRTDRAGYGVVPKRSRFGPGARIGVQETSWALESQYGRSAVFFTFTVPGKGALVAAAIAAWSGYIIKRIRQWIRDVVSGQHGVIGVWEHQKRGMLHLHICVASTNTAALQELIDKRHEYWGKLLADVTFNSKINVCFCSDKMSRCIAGGTTQQDAQWVRESIGRYLSKYVSKGSRQSSKHAFFSPSRWWTVDRATHNLAKMHRTVSCMEGFILRDWHVIVQDIVEQSEALANKFVQYVNPYDNDMYGIVAWFQPGLDLQFLSLIDAVVGGYQALGWGFRNKGRP